MTDYTVPNKEWSQESLELFKKLNELTTKEELGWKKVESNYPHNMQDGPRYFLKPHKEQEKFLEYVFFNNPSLKCLKGVAHFGICTSGAPLGIVHGGALFSILDTAMGSCVYKCGYSTLAANVNINYQKPVPLNSTLLIEASINKVEGKKVFTSAVLKSVCGDVTFANCTGIFVRLSSSY